MVQLITVNEAKQFLEITSNTFDTLINSIVNYASATAETYCGREFLASNVTELHNGGKTSIFVEKIPINYIISVFEYDGNEYVSLVGSNNTTQELPNTYSASNTTPTYYWDGQTGKISKQIDSGTATAKIGKQPTFNNYPKGIKILYNGGYSSIPDDIKLAVLELTKMIYKKESGTKNISFQSETKTTEVLSANFPPHVRRVLELYRILQ